MKIIRPAAVLLLLFCLSACAPSFGLKMSVPSMPDATSITPAGLDEARARVKVGAFTDARASDTMATVDGREIPSDGSVGGAVQEGFERYFREAGMRVVLTSAPVIDGEVTEWKAKILPGFPSSDAIATARLHIMVKDSHRHVIYSGNFSGEASVSHPLLDEDHVRQLLGQAMAGAMQAAVDEEDVRVAIAKGRIE